MNAMKKRSLALLFATVVILAVWGMGFLLQRFDLIGQIKRLHGG